MQNKRERQETKDKLHVSEGHTPKDRKVTEKNRREGDDIGQGDKVVKVRGRRDDMMMDRDQTKDNAGTKKGRQTAFLMERQETGTKERNLK